MTHVRLRLDIIRKAAEGRPAGYYEDVVSAGVLPGDDTLLLPKPEWDRLRAKYGPPASSTLVRSGPGTELKAMLKKWLGVAATPNCPCNAHAAQMDAWGPDECERRLDEIVGWLSAQATARGLPFSRMVAGQMVRLAIRRARKAAGK